MTSKTPILFDEGWEKFQEQGLKLLTSFLTTGENPSFGRKEYSDLYTLLYNMCIQRPPYNYSQRLYEKYNQCIEDYLITFAVPDVQNADELNLLECINSHWQNFLLLVKWMKNFFQYLDRYYVGHNSLPQLRTCAMHAFMKELFTPQKERIGAAFRRKYELDRQGIDNNRNVMKSITAMFFEMGSELNKENPLDEYENQIEKQLIEDSSAYFDNLTAGWVVEDSCSEYFIKAETLLHQEIQRQEQCLPQSSRQKIIGVFMQHVIVAHENTILEKKTGIDYLLRCGKTEDLKRIYSLCSQVKAGLVPVAIALKQHMKEEGEKVIKMRETTVSQERKESNKDYPFIAKLSALLERFKLMIYESFSNDSTFQRAIKAGMEDIVNQNIGKYSTAEILASYCDNILKKSSQRLRDEEVEDLLSKAVELFESISDKDMFADLYRNQLARRLLTDRSANEDAEKLMIAKMKMCCGAQFTAKFEGMITDIQLAQNVKNQYENRQQELPIEFSVQVLTAANWPSYKIFNSNIPADLEFCMRNFEDFYRRITDHRKIQWVFSLGSAVVTGNFQGKKYDFVCSTYQTFILLLFNNYDRISYSELKSILSFDDDTSKKLLNIRKNTSFPQVPRLQVNQQR